MSDILPKKSELALVKRTIKWQLSFLGSQYFITPNELFLSYLFLTNLINRAKDQSRNVLLSSNLNFNRPVIIKSSHKSNFPTPFNFGSVSYYMML